MRKVLESSWHIVSTAGTFAFTILLINAQDSLCKGIIAHSSQLRRQAEQENSCLRTRLGETRNWRPGHPDWKSLPPPPPQGMAQVRLF